MGVLSQADKAQIAFLVLCFEIWVAMILHARKSLSYHQIAKNVTHEKQLVYHQI